MDLPGLSTLSEQIRVILMEMDFNKGFTRRQMLAVVAGEGAAWTGIGAIAGVLLGLAVSVVVLVYVVSPQSFHWTMEMNIPSPRLWALCAAVVVSGTVTAWLAGRAAAGRDAVMAVKEDW